MDEKNYVTALVGSLLGLLPLVVSAFISWLEKRSRIACKEEAIDFAQKQVAFLSAWMQARQQSDADQAIIQVKKEVGAELDEIKAHVDAMMDIPHERPMVKTDERNFFQRLVAALCPVHSGWLGLSRFIFHVFGWDYSSVYCWGVARSDLWSHDIQRLGQPRLFKFAHLDYSRGLPRAGDWSDHRAEKIFPPIQSK